MPMKKQSLSLLAIAGFTTISVVSHQAQAQALPRDQYIDPID